MNWRALVVSFVIGLGLFDAGAGAQEATFEKGMPLVDALQSLQARGLSIIFSSAVVTPDLRVTARPRSSTARQQLDELLAPHALEIHLGPGGTLQIVRTEPSVKRKTRESPDPTASVLSNPPPEETALQTPPRYDEFVSVRDSVQSQTSRDSGTVPHLDRTDLAQFHGGIADDPLRVVQTLAGVTAVDDVRSDFAVRGSPFRQVGVVIDGMSTHWLQHTTRGRGATGSLTMMPGLAFDSATLRTGAYPRRYGDRLGSELDLRLREGSRRAFAVRGGVGRADAVLVAEGPVGRRATGLAPGSWLVSARRSYLEWPPEDTQPSRTTFGYWDGLAKVVFDVRPTQQVALTILGGLAKVEEEDNPRPGDLAAGANRASALSLSWRSTIGPALLITQQASFATRDFRNAEQTGDEASRGANRALAYRADLSRRIARGRLESGVTVERTSIEDVARASTTILRGSAWQRSGFVHVVFAPYRSVTISPGVRVSSSTLARTPSLSRWLLGEWSLHPGWSVSASTGVSRQLPELLYVVNGAGETPLRAERASHVEFGIARHMTNGVGWQAMLYHRNESDILRMPDLYPRVANDRLVFSMQDQYANALKGTSRGIELSLSRRSEHGLSGWIAYAFGRTRHTDTTSHETYWADFDQRHNVNVVARYHLSNETSFGATFRAGSNIPIPAFLEQHEGRLVAGTMRNQVRLPRYTRLDVRGDRRLHYLGQRLTVFIEAVNVLNRANVGVGDGSIDPVTRDATGFAAPLLRRRLSAGIFVEF